MVTNQTSDFFLTLTLSIEIQVFLQCIFHTGWKAMFYVRWVYQGAFRQAR